MFTSTIALFDKYYQHLDAIGAPGFNRDLGCEVRERLQQLTYIANRVKELEGIAKGALDRHQGALKAHLEGLRNRGVSFESAPLPTAAKITNEEMETHNKAQFELKLLTEAFYYFAGRIRTILRNATAPLPHLAGFECEGVRNTRNKLLEHAEGKDSQVSIQSFAFGAECGPVIKALRYGGQEDVFPDRGLYENAEEFRSNLERLINRALSNT